MYVLRCAEWQPPHSERHLVTVVGSVVPHALELDLPRDVNAHAFSKYVNIYFKVQSSFASIVLPGFL